MCNAINDYVLIAGRSMECDDSELCNAFKIFDADGDGYISLVELRDTLMIVGEKVLDCDINRMFNEADLDGDGLLSYEEFAEWMRTH